MAEKIKVSWVTGFDKWAYDSLYGHNSKALPDYEHRENEKKADVFVCFSPESLRFAELKKTIMHWDSGRLG